MKDIDRLRNQISTLFDMGEEITKEELKKIYDNRFKYQKELEPLFEIIFHTSYAINYYIKATTKKPEAYYKNLENCNNINDFIKNMSFGDFYAYCDDVSYFHKLHKYQKKVFLNKSLEQRNKISKVSSLYMKDIKSINRVIPTSIISEKYEENYKITNDKAVAIEDTICEMIDYLIDLEEEDYNAYETFFGDILDVYYIYNKYLIENGREIDEYASDIVDKVERDRDGFINYSSANEYAIEPVIRDYINYHLLSKEEKQQISDFSLQSGEYTIINPNEMIRRFLCETFLGLNLSNEDCVIIFKDKLNTIKNDDEIFNLIAPVLYLDNYTYDYSMYISNPSQDNKINIDFIKDFNNIEVFKQYLIEDDYNFLNTIYKSMYYHFSPLISKKSTFNDMFNDNAYDYCITDNYLFDVMEFYRKHNIKDLYSIYNTEYKYDGDPEATAIRSSSSLANELLDIQSLDEENYKELMRYICKDFYALEKYKILNNDKSITKFDKDILKKMDKNIDSFINNIIGEYGVLIYILQVFYEYNGLSMYELSEIKEYVDNDLKDNVVIKKLNQKNKKS